MNTAMPLANITQDTLITFPQGRTADSSRILAALICGESDDHPVAGIVTESTPFHPIDYKWPDQPGDTGRIETKNGRFLIFDSVVGTVNKSNGQFALDKEISVPRGDPSSYFVVVHLTYVLAESNLDCLVGTTAELSVDIHRRKSLSASHTASHLAALSLNSATQGFWLKDITNLDSYGNPDFDQLAIMASKISVEGSLDRYRLGKSLRRIGFDTTAFWQALDTVCNSIQRDLESWTQAAARIRLQAPNLFLSTRRKWICDLPHGTAHVPCGGTHPETTEEVGHLAVSLVRDSQQPEVLLQTRRMDNRRVKTVP